MAHKAGLAVSTDQLNCAGVKSTLPAASLARTANVCGPSLRLLYVAGLVQALKPPLSSWHSKARFAGSVTSSVPEKWKTAVVALVGLVGPLSTVVVGGVLSVIWKAWGTSGATL